MCGINGIFAYGTNAPSPDETELLRARDQMAHRGPDGKGVWWSDDKRVGFGHRRLSILDLSSRADQPLVSSDGRYSIVFNGEIYNFPTLRKALIDEGVHFNTTSDTELLVKLYERYGKDMLAHLRGMYAFAIWDREKRGCFIARDPLGIKPLYLVDDGNTLRFSSQVKSLLAGGAVSSELSPAGVVGFYLWGSVPEPFTLYASIRSFPAGHYMWIATNEISPQAVPFASIPEVISQSPHQFMDEPTIVHRLGKSVRESVSAHLLSDVDVAVFLSAGVDSSALLAIATECSSVVPTSITLGFEEFSGTHEDEVPLAAATAKMFGSRHIVRRVSEQEFRDDLDLILDRMDQPSIDGVNTWFVSKAANEAGFKVALSGLGGDEILAGYPGFRQIPRTVSLMRALSSFPFAKSAIDGLISWLDLSKSRPKLSGLTRYGADYAGAYFLRRALYLPFEIDAMLNTETVQSGLQHLQFELLLNASISPDPGSPIARISSLELSNYTRNQLLRDADWAGMAHSVEIRTPLLDWDLLRDVSPLLPLMKNGVGKRALSKAPISDLPNEVLNRKKTGFGVPTGNWLARAQNGQSKTEAIGTKGGASRAWAAHVLASINGGDLC